jgi:hypothetical protein
MRAQQGRARSSTIASDHFPEGRFTEELRIRLADSNQDLDAIDESAPQS